MRIQAIPEFDPEKEYKIGERVIHQGRVLVAVKWVEIPKILIEDYVSLNLFPTQCGMCSIRNRGCKSFDSPCFRWNRSDRKKINFRFKRYAKRDKKI